MHLKLKQHALKSLSSVNTSTVTTTSSSGKYANGFNPPTCAIDSSTSVEKSNIKDNSELHDDTMDSQSDSVVWIEESTERASKTLAGSDSEDEDRDYGFRTDRWDVSSYKNFDVTVLSSLPVDLRQSVIEDMLRKERQERRQTYLPVAGDAALYSQTQLANFLKTRFDIYDIYIIVICYCIHIFVW